MGFRSELELAINRYSQENGSNTPDHILAEYLQNCLVAFDTAVNARERWHDREGGWRVPIEPRDLEWRHPAVEGPLKEGNLSFVQSKGA